MIDRRMHPGYIGWNFSRRVKFLWRHIHAALRVTLRRDYIYNYPYQLPERWGELEYLKYCYWTKEADQLEKDIMLSFK